ncbi:hypothetical protein ABE151_17430 [Bacillus paralicheniformis]|uniref:hypothetical protein n=1 Tax=Bacillus paralicheniformis TaxID=1648923 RepID=UPI003D1CB5F8
MNKELILEQVRKGIEQNIECMRFDNLPEVKSSVVKYFDFLEILTALPDTSADSPKEVNIESEPLKENNVSERKAQITSIENVSIFSNPDHFLVKEWLLTGGAIAVNPEHKKEERIPESVVRNKHIYLSDIVEIIYSGDSNFKDFKIIKRGTDYDKYDDERIVLERCTVVKQDEMLVVTHDMYGNVIKYNETPFTIRILDYDKTKFNLETGDLVDIAYLKNRPEKARVFWKHTGRELVGNDY